MDRLEAYILSASGIIEAYKGKEPFAVYLKQYYAANKKHGSRDRKAISELCYNYWRLKNILPSIELAKQISLAAEYIATVSEKRPSAQEYDKLFPLIEKLSEKIDKEKFLMSMLRQPRLFCRVRPGYLRTFERKCEDEKIEYTKYAEDCFRFAPNFPLQNYFRIDKEIVIQDIASQQVFNEAIPAEKVFSIWDCCAASGGKSILFYDRLQKKGVNIFASDIRQSILKNYASRMQAANVPFVKADVIDLEKSIPENYLLKFDTVICDVPCSSSGTWARSPEQLSLFDKETIKTYAEKQKAIALNAIKSLKPNGHLYYITCSVFADENENVVEQLLAQGDVAQIHEAYHQYSDDGGDTLYSCLLRKK